MLFGGKKEYIPKFIKFGSILVQQGLVTNSQLEAAVVLKEERDDKLLGEIIAAEFAIPELEIEKIYLNHIIIPYVERWFFKELAKKIQVPNWSVEKGIPQIEATIKSYSRQMIRSSSYATVDGKLTVTTSQATIAKVRAIIDKLTIFTNLGQELVFADLGFELNPSHQILLLENPSIILEARIRIMQLVKRVEGRD